MWKAATIPAISVGSSLFGWDAFVFACHFPTRTLYCNNLPTNRYNSYHSLSESSPIVSPKNTKELWSYVAWCRRVVMDGRPFRVAIAFFFANFPQSEPKSFSIHWLAIHASGFSLDRVFSEGNQPTVCFVLSFSCWYSFVVTTTSSSSSSSTTIF